MTWSTRELAELAGATVNTIRHYHRLGLMEEPIRRSNGYKQYRVGDLVRLLRIRRLAELGVPLSQVAEISAGEDNATELMGQLDAELAAKIERLRHARASIAAIVRNGASADVPPRFEAFASRVSEADSSMLHLYTQLYDEAMLSDVERMVAADTDAASADLGRLSPDADEETKAELISRLTPTLAQNFLDYPWLLSPASRLPQQRHVTAHTLADAVAELYNPAQLDVLSRASIAAVEQTGRPCDRATSEEKSQHPGSTGDSTCRPSP